jgi:site-specific DNA-cytosine methylase
MSLTVTDLFCGAGGSSTGAIQVPGIQVRTAMNHWARAIETHNTNHPDVDHVCADPEYIATTDILWASPECTNHSVGDPACRPRPHDHRGRIPRRRRMTVKSHRPERVEPAVNSPSMEEQEEHQT